MNYFFDMDWNTKCDWENLFIFNSKGSENSTKLQPMDWGVEDGELATGSFTLSGWGVGNGVSALDVGHGSSAKSSISASTDSSSREGVKSSNFSFEAFEGFVGLGGFKRKESAEVELTGSSSPVEGSISSTEPLIGLRLGKRTYFENNCGPGIAKTSSLSVVPISPATTAKKTKSCDNPPTARCQAEGCNLDLSSAKDYHRKHRVCESHSKSPKVVVGGLERRFCQQCSRFHSLSEFDAKKRSCRRRLSDHNARRRKPQQESFQFNSTRLSSSFYDRQQVNFLSTNPLNLQSRSSGSLIWETCSSKFTQTKGHLLKPEKIGVIDGQPHLPGGLAATYAASEYNHDSNMLVPSICTESDASNQGFKEHVLSFNSDAALDFGRALSLLSSNSYSSCEAEPMTLDEQLHVPQSGIPSHLIDLVPQGLPLTSSEYWLTGQLSDHSRALSARAISSDVEEIQLRKAPFMAEFHSNPLQ